MVFEYSNQLGWCFKYYANYEINKQTELLSINIASQCRLETFYVLSFNDTVIAIKILLCIIQNGHYHKTTNRILITTNGIVCLFVFCWKKNTEKYAYAAKHVPHCTHFALIWPVYKHTVKHCSNMYESKADFLQWCFTFDLMYFIN